MDTNLAFTGTVVAIDVTSMVFNSAKVNDLLSRNGVSPSKTGTSVLAFDLVLGLAFAWVPDANNGYAVRSRCARAVSDLSFLTEEVVKSADFDKKTSFRNIK